MIYKQKNKKQKERNIYKIYILNQENKALHSFYTDKKHIKDDIKQTKQILKQFKKEHPKSYKIKYGSKHLKVKSKILK